MSSQGERLKFMHSENGRLRLDAYGAAGESYFIKASGDGDIEFEVNNLVELNSGTLQIQGDSDLDRVRVVQGDSVLVDVNGLFYQFQTGRVDGIQISGHGSDLFQLTTGGGDDRILLEPGLLHVTTPHWTLRADGFGEIQVDSGAGHDRVTLLDSQGKDVFETDTLIATLGGTEFFNQVEAFEQLVVHATAGQDSAKLVGTSGVDQFSFRDGSSFVRTAEAMVTAIGFDTNVFGGRGGNDSVNLFDSEGYDQFHLRPDGGRLDAAAFDVWVNHVSRLQAVSRQGEDLVRILGSEGNDRLEQLGEQFRFRGQGFSQQAIGFTRLIVDAAGGFDTAQLQDTAGDDQLFMNQSRTRLKNATFQLVAEQFERSNVIQRFGGNDSVQLIGTAWSDSVYADANGISLAHNGGILSRVVGFANVHLDTRLGEDWSTLVGSIDNDTLDINTEWVHLQSSILNTSMKGLEHVHFDGHGGIDRLFLDDLDELDLLSGFGDRVEAFLGDLKVDARDIDWLDAHAASGSRYDIQAVDYLYSLRGIWDKWF